MPRKVDPLKLDHGIEMYVSGQSFPQIAATLGISATTLKRVAVARGIPLRDDRFTPGIPAEEIVRRYVAGESEYALSNDYGVSRNVIRRYLEKAGVEPRSHSDAGLVRASKMTKAERHAQAEAAHAAARGRKRPEHEAIKMALGRERAARIGSPGEQQMLEWLTERGHRPVIQKAVQKFNVDLAVEPVAVEILGGGWHLEKRHHAARTPQILNAGWHLVFVWNHEGSSALTPKAADYVVAFLEQIRRDPPAIGEYRVIAGNGQLLAAGRADDDKFPLVPPPRGRAM